MVEPWWTRRSKPPRPLNRVTADRPTASYDGPRARRTPASEAQTLPAGRRQWSKNQRYFSALSPTMISTSRSPTSTRTSSGDTETISNVSSTTSPARTSYRIVST